MEPVQPVGDGLEGFCPAVPLRSPSVAEQMAEMRPGTSLWLGQLELYRYLSPEHISGTLSVHLLSYELATLLEAYDAGRDLLLYARVVPTQDGVCVLGISLEEERA